jgi:hypothetical protein
MTASNPVVGFLATLVPWLPGLIIYIVGLMFALVTWRRHPRASLLSLIAFVMFIVNALLQSAFWYMLYGGLLVGEDFGRRNQVIGIGGGFFSVLNIMAWIFVLIALFARRPQEPDGNTDDPYRFRRPFAEPAAPSRRSGPPSEDIRK